MVAPQHLLAPQHHRRLRPRHALQIQAVAQPPAQAVAQLQAQAVAHLQAQAVAQAVTLVRQLEPAGRAAQAAIAQLAASTVRTLAQMA